MTTAEMLEIFRVGYTYAALMGTALGGFVVHCLYVHRGTARRVRSGTGPGLPHHRKLDRVTASAQSEAFWMRWPHMDARSGK